MVSINVSYTVRMSPFNHEIKNKILCHCCTYDNIIVVVNSCAEDPHKQKK